MRFASIAERELRVGARNRLTHRLRWLATLLFFGFATWLFWVTDAGNRRGSGPRYLSALSYAGLFYFLLMGAVRASDALSVERREGTLGLLFLTPLRGVDILTGKLCSHGLGALYALLAVLPILALPLLLGGVDGERVFRVMLAWLSGLFLAIVVGLAASLICVRHARSAPLAVLAILAIALAPLALTELLQAAQFPNRSAIAASLLSPYTALAFADPMYRPGGLDWFYRSIATILGFSGVLLLWIGWRLNWTWRDAPDSTWLLRGLLNLRRQPPPAPSRTAARSLHANAGTTPKPDPAGAAARRRTWLGRASLGDADPFAWWAGRGSGIWLLTLLLMAALVVINVYVAVPFAVAQFGPQVLAGAPGHLICWIPCTGILHAIVLYVAGVAASSRVAEDRRTGALELLLAVPGAFAGILRGMRGGYRRALIGPAALATLAHLHTTWIAGELLSLELRSEGRVPPSTPELLLAILTGLDTNPPSIPWELRFMLGSWMLVWIPLAICWATTGALGRWLALRMKHTGLVPLACIALLCVPPILLFSVLVMIADKAGVTRLPQHVFLPTYRWIGIGLVLLNAAILGSWAADAFRRRFRALVTQSAEPGQPAEWSIALRFALRRVVVVTLLLFLVAGSIRIYQRHQANERWHRFKSSLMEQGQPLTPAPLPPVAEESNFAAAPPLRARLENNRGAPDHGPDYVRALLADSSRFDHANLQSLNYRFMTRSPSDLSLEQGLNVAGLKTPLTGLDAAAAQAFIKLTAPLDAELREVAAAIVRRPHFRSPHLSPSPLSNALSESMPQEERLLDRWQHVFVCRASARLALGQTEPAFTDVLTALRLARALEAQPGFFSHGRRHALLLRLLQPIWEAGNTQAWTAAQWQTIQSGLSELRLFECHTNIVNRVMLAQIAQWTGPQSRSPARIARALSSRPDTDLAIVLHDMTRHALRRVDAANGRVRPETSYYDPVGNDMNYLPKNLILQPTWFNQSALSIGFVSAWVQQAMVACALERYRLTHGRYPPDLPALAPAFLATIPSDPMRFGALHYRAGSTTSEAPYTLRSAGPNGRLEIENKGADDWIWSYQVPPGAGL